MKADIIYIHETHWSSIRDKVGAWVKAEWKNWEQEKPEWFTDNWKKEMVLKDMIPEKGIEEAVTVESEKKKDVIVTVEGAQGGRRKSLIDIINQNYNNNRYCLYAPIVMYFLYNHLFPIGMNSYMDTFLQIAVISP